MNTMDKSEYRYSIKLIDVFLKFDMIFGRSVFCYTQWGEQQFLKNTPKYYYREIDTMHNMLVLV